MELRYGDLQVWPLPTGKSLPAQLQPARGFDVGAGSGHHWSGTISGGEVGILLDGRGRRPFGWATSAAERLEQVKGWREKP